MGETSRIPTGLRFDPSDEELITHYLYPKIMGWPLEWEWIAEKELYGANSSPAVVFGDVGESSPYWNGGAAKKKKKTIFVFTKLTKTSSISKQTSRRAGSGKWIGQTSPKNVVERDTGAVVGSVKTLTWKCDKDCGGGDPTHWIMHEYSLSRTGLEAIGGRMNDVVLCKIRKWVNEADRRRYEQRLAPPVVDRNGNPAAIAVKESDSPRIQKFPPRFFPVVDWKGNPAAFSVEESDRRRIHQPPQQFNFLVVDQNGTPAVIAVKDSDRRCDHHLPPQFSAVVNQNGAPAAIPVEESDRRRIEQLPPQSFPVDNENITPAAIAVKDSDCRRIHHLPLQFFAAVDQNEAPAAVAGDKITNKRPPQEQDKQEEEDRIHKKHKSFDESLLLEAEDCSEDAGSMWEDLAPLPELEKMERSEILRMFVLDDVEEKKCSNTQITKSDTKTLCI